MSDPRWLQVEELFHRVRGLEPQEREACLQQVPAGDERIVAAVRRLLAAAPEADSRFERPPSLAGLLEGMEPPVAGAAGEMEGSLVGVWRIDRKLASGGMGDVYLAHRADDQFRKQAAVKLLRRGFDSELMRRRFRTERQILASLEHPGIARLLDGGIHSDGSPYLVMEYVEGETVDSHCQRQQLGVRERLLLFRQICQAVGSAHASLVVHRDLKPSNILVTAAGAVKLLDFGIAKLLDAPEAGEATSSTSVLMTPRYASPEQVLGKPAGTQSDVYSLGVLLFELLCGRSPYARTERSMAEWFAVVPNEEAPPASRVAERAEWRRQLSGDLDLIVAKALRKEPAERYSSVEQLEADVARYLAGEPILARPQTARYMAGKFIRRHRGGVAAIGLALLGLSGGLVAALWGVHVANQERQRAELRFSQVRQLARLSLFDLFDVVKDIPGSTAAQQLLVSKSLEHFERLARESAGDPALLAELAAGYGRLADLSGNPYQANLGDPAKAVEVYRKGLDVLRAVPEGQGGAALERSRAILWRGLGEVTAYLGDAPKGVEMLRRAVRLLEGVAARDASDVETAVELASTRGSLGDFLGGIGGGPVVDRKASIDCFTRELDDWRKIASLPGVAAATTQRARRGGVTAGMKLGNAALGEGRNEEALGRYRAALSELERIDGGDQKSLPSVRLWTMLLRGQSQALIGLSRAREAVDAVSPALAVLRDLARRDPANQQFSYGVTVTLRTHAEALNLAGDPAGALADYRELQQRLKDQLAADPGNATTQGRLAEVEQAIGDLAASPAGRR